MSTVAGLLMVVGVGSASACTQLLGGFDFTGKGTGGGTSSSANTGGASGTTTGTGGTEAGAPPGGEVWGEGLQNFSGSPSGIVVDTKGNTYVTGNYMGTLTIGGSSLTAAEAGSFFLVSFDSTGMYRWAASFDAIYSVFSSSVAVDANDNVIFACVLSSASVTVGSVMYPNPSGVNTNAVLLASFDTVGTPRWVTTYGTVNTSAYPLAVGVDSNGDVVVTGQYAGAFTFGTLQPLPGNGTMFLAQFDGATGSPNWASGYGSVANQSQGTVSPIGLAINSGDDIVVAGNFSESLQIGGNAFVTAGSPAFFIAEFDVFGDPKWSNQYGSPREDDVYAVAIDPAGAVLVSGILGATTDLGGGDVVTTGSGFVAKYDGSGAFEWTQIFGGGLGSCECSRTYVTSDALGNVVLAGYSPVPVDFGGGALTPLSNVENVYLAKLGDTGKYDWAKIFGNTMFEYNPVVATDPSTKEIVLAFINDGTVNLGTNTVVSTADMASLVVARFQP